MKHTMDDKTGFEVPACHARIEGTQNICTRDAGHVGEHRCKAVDVDNRARYGAAETE